MQNPLCRPNTRPHFITFTPSSDYSIVPSTLKPERWQLLLKRYPDSQFSEIIAGIAKYGAQVGYEGPIVRIRGRNHPSVLHIPSEISQNIAAEVSAARVKQIQHGDLPHFYYISPLGAVQKKTNGLPTGWRRIHDLSYPNGKSVNDGIAEQYGTLVYQTIDDAIQLIGKHGHRAILRKRDLKDAFRMVPVSPLDYWLFIFEWNGKLYIDLFLPFGLRTAPFIFNLFSEGLHWISNWVFGRDLVHYLDDFLFVNDPDPEFFGTLTSYLGFTENVKKRKDGWVVDFTGIELDSDRMEARLPKDKHNRAIMGVQKLLTSGSVTHRTLENLLGFLSFCAKVIPLGRPFLRNLFNLLKRLSHLHSHAIRCLSTAAKRDLLWWMTLLPHWSGILMINPTRSQIIIHTDASGVKGIGGWWDKHHAFSTRLAKRHRTKLIDWKEAYAVLFAFAKWGECWKGHAVLVMCDNTVVVNAINSKSVRGESIDPLQLILLTTALYDIEVSCQWLSSKDNWIADALSCFDIKKIADIFPQFSLAKNLYSHPYRMSGKPMSELQEKLGTYFGMDLLPIFTKSTVSVKLPMSDLLPNMDLPLPSLFDLKHSLSSLLHQLKKRQRKQQKGILATSAAITSTMASVPTSSLMKESDVSSGVPVVCMGKNQSAKGWRSQRKFSKPCSSTSI